TSDSPEVELLRQSAAALSTLPPQAPSPEAQEAVAVHAAEASAAPVLAAYGEASGVESPEVALLAASRQALDTLPRHAPSATAVAAVLAAAAEASGAAVPAGAAAGAAGASRPRRRAADRGVATSARPRTRIGALAGLSTLAVAILAGILFLRSGDSLAPEADLAALAEPTQEASAADAAPSEPLVQVAPDPEPTPEAAPPAAPPPFVSRTAPRGPSAEGFAPVAAQRAPAPAPTRQRSAPEAESAFMADAVPAEALTAASGDEAATDWEAGEDIRLLSLRLRQLREENAGLEWGEPAVPLGQSAPTTGTTPGVQAVREGAPTGRVRARTPVQDR
ncbi:MAG: hypothetical protein AAFQ43_12655, partial [Bacteroidota bacterium]